MIFLFLAFFRLEVSVDTHEASDSSDILVGKSLQKSKNSHFWRFSSHVKENADLRIELTAKALEEP